MHFLQRNIQSVLQAIVLPTHLCFSVCKVSDRNERNLIFFPLVSSSNGWVSFSLFLWGCPLPWTCIVSVIPLKVWISLTRSEWDKFSVFHPQTEFKSVHYVSNTLDHFTVSFNKKTFTFLRVLQHFLLSTWNATSGFFFKDLTAHQPLVPLLLLPDLLLTSDWSWRTTASCWNQLAAMPGTKIDPVSLPTLSDWSLFCSSVTSSGLIFELSTTSWVHIALTTVCDRWCNSPRFATGSQVGEGISCFL